jgi:outer membrane protein assembly factor BamB
MRQILFSLFLMFALASTVSRADDWPQWLGPHRDAVYREEGIVSQFPEQGLKVKWRVPLDWGYAGPAVAGDRVFVMDYKRVEGELTNNPGGRDKLRGQESVKCFDVRDGSLLWTHQYDRPYNMSFAGGPRCTPTVDGPRVYALGAEGNLWCLEGATGRVLWSKDFVRDYGAETAIWGVAAHPLVDGNRLYCVVGGQGSVAVAFNKLTGEEIWQALSASQPGYCPPTMIEHGGTRQLLIWHAESVNALEPASGQLIWSVPVKPSYGMAIAAPRKLGAELLVTGIGNAALMRLNEDATRADLVWRATTKTALFCGTSTPFLEEGIAYGCDINTGALTAVRLRDGQRLWQTRQPTTGGDRRQQYGTAFLVKHQDRFFLFSETGDLILARLSPERYEEISRFRVLEPTNEVFGRAVVWSQPAFAHTSMFARNDKELVCVDLAASGQAE